MSRILILSSLLRFWSKNLGRQCVIWSLRLLTETKFDGPPQCLTWSFLTRDLGLFVCTIVGGLERFHIGNRIFVSLFNSQCHENDWKPFGADFSFLHLPLFFLQRILFIMIPINKSFMSWSMCSISTSLWWWLEPLQSCWTWPDSVSVAIVPLQPKLIHEFV